LHGAKVSATKIGIAMKKLGFEKVKTRDGIKYKVLELTFDDIKARKLVGNASNMVDPQADALSEETKLSESTGELPF